MFRHPVKNDETNPEKMHVNEDSVTDVAEKNVETPDQSDIYDAVEEDDTIESGFNEEDIVDDGELDKINVNDKTFNNPSQTANKISEQTFKCEKCDFKAERIFDYKKNKKQIHNWCCFCLSSYKTQEIFKIFKDHN